MKPVTVSVQYEPVRRQFNAVLEAVQLEVVLS
jgi:hypothetical protein